jgi:hypothetical protein
MARIRSGAAPSHKGEERAGDLIAALVRDFVAPALKRARTWTCWICLKTVGGVWVATSISIVDDCKFARIVVGKAVSAIRPDWERLVAGIAAEALDLLSRRYVDVVILDYNMPGKNGLELAEELRRRSLRKALGIGSARE